MERAEQTRLVTRIQEHMRNDTTDEVDSAFFKRAADYVDPTLTEAEHRQLFREYPTVIGHRSQLSGPGSFFTAEIVGLSLLVVEQEDGSVKTFLNACQHRGARVVEESSGSKMSFRCPYHAWTYGRNGDLLAIPDREAFCDIDPTDRGLTEIPTEVRHGLIWVCPNGGDLDVSAYLGDLDNEFTAYDLGTWHEAIADEMQLDVNWKLFVDGFLEVYHLPYLHGATVGKFVHGNHSVTDTFGPHARMIGRRRKLSEEIDTPPEEVDLLANVVIIYHLFPSTIVIWQMDHFEVWSTFPSSGRVDSSTTRLSLLTRSPEEAEAHAEYWQKNWKLAIDTVYDEDLRVSRGITANVMAGASNDVVFGRNEPALQHFHRTLETEVRAEA